ncbi:MAG TPA: hypothetical protein VE981_13500 [Planctomycetota bacterium]|nr:hypothetical protein [Planctomycetota bacterium]
MGQDLFKGSLRARLDRIAEAARVLHKALIDETQREFEKTHGRITNPYALFTIVANDPAFAWLQPMTSAIVEVEELADRKEPPLAETDLSEARAKLERLLASETEAFGRRYQALIQSSPDIAVEQGLFHAAMREATGRP